MTPEPRPVARRAAAARHLEAARPKNRETVGSSGICVGTIGRALLDADGDDRRRDASTIGAYDVAAPDRRESRRVSVLTADCAADADGAAATAAPEL